MLTLIRDNRALIEQRSRELLLARSVPKPSQADLARGIPLLLDQLVEALAAGELRDSEIVAAAATYARRLFALGFTVSEVVHGYGALCEVVMALATERDIWFDPRDFELFNRALDAAIAGAVTEYEAQHRDAAAARERETVGALAHELRSSLGAAVTAFAMIRQGSVGVSGRTAEVVDRSLRRMADLLDRAVAYVRLEAGATPVAERVRVVDVLDQIVAVSQREAALRGQTLEVDIDHHLELDADRQLLVSTVSNLVHNALKYSHPSGHVHVRGFGQDGQVTIEVEDECGGLPDGKGEALLLPFVMRATRALRGALRVRDLPGKGCVLALELPRAVAAQAPAATS